MALVVPTFLHVGLGDEHRQNLTDEIIYLESVEQSHKSHNVGGWRTPPDLFERHSFQWLRDKIIAVMVDGGFREIQPQTIRAWAVVNRNGTRHGRHFHGTEYQWSGIYYVTPGDPPSSKTIFELGSEQTMGVDPVADLLVVFPSKMWHSVETYHGEAPRITIAFDIKSR